MSDEITPITLTTLYEMMMDLTRRVERIELILSEHPSSSRGAPGVAMPSLPHLTPSMFATLGASHPRPRPHPVLQQHSASLLLATSTRPPSGLRPSGHALCHGILAPRLLGHFRILCLHSFGLTYIVCTIIKRTSHRLLHRFYGMPYRHCRFGIFGHPQSTMFPIPTSARAMVDFAWRGLAYDLWMAYDVRIDRLLDVTVTYFARIIFEIIVEHLEYSWYMILEGLTWMGGLHFALLTFYTGIGALQCMHALFRSFMSLGPRDASFSLSFPIIASLHFITSRWFFILFFVISIVCSASSSSTPSGNPPRFITWRVVTSFPLSIIRTLIQGSLA
ncbi:hypothetical protein AAG906_006219 [Vitis piasezkii]